MCNVCTCTCRWTELVERLTSSRTTSRITHNTTNTMYNHNTTRQHLQAQGAGEVTERMEEILVFAKKHIAEARERMSEQANRHHKDVDYEVEDMVFLNSKNIKTQRSLKKLNDKMLGPFKIIAKIGRAFRLELPRTMLIHNVFHSSLLRKAATDPLPDQRQTPSPPIIVNDQEEWEVDEILNSRHFECGRQLQYQVKWHGWDRDLEWYNANGEEFENCKKLIQEYHQANPEKLGP